MNIIRAMRYAVMTIFNCMPLKTFKQLCECYAEGNERVSATLAAYMATNSLTKKYYGSSSTLLTECEKYFAGSKLEIIFQIGTRKMWNLYVESVKNRHLSVPEQFILIKKMPADAFCKMYAECVNTERIKWFDNDAAKMLLLEYRNNYNKLLWYVKHCQISAPVLSLFVDLFMTEVIELEKSNAPEPNCSICNVFRQWMVAEKAPEDSFKSYSAMLDFAILKQENLQNEAEALLRLLSNDLNFINTQY